MMLWNINTINDRKLKRINEIINFLEDNELTGAHKSTKSNSTLLNEIDVIAIIEMGKKYSKFNPYNLNGFNLFSQLRPNRKGGGIGIYVRKNLNAHVIYSELTDDYEILHLEITKYEDTRNVIGMYRPPSGKFDPFIQALEALLMRIEENVVILGDINLNTNTNSGSLSPHSNDYNSLLNNYNHCIYNQAVTRFNKVTNKHSTIDHVISHKNRNDIIALTSSNIVTENFSDHQLILVKEYGNPNANTSPKSPKTIEKVNKKRVFTELKNNFNLLPINIHPSKLCDNILGYIKSVIKNNTSKITLKFTKENETVPQWADMNYINLCNRIHNMTELIHKLHSSHRPVSNLKTQLNAIIEEKEKYAAMRTKSYYSDKIILNNKEAWKTLNQLSGKNEIRSDIILEDNGVRINDSSAIANIFQEHFLSIVGKSTECSDLKIIDERNINEFKFQEVTPIDVKNVINLLDIGKASGMDNISPFLWTQISDECSLHVSVLINQMFSISIYPANLKETQVIPIHKKDSKLCKINYRPISITNSLDKIVEKIMQYQINEFLENEKILDKYQYGFKKGRSCEDVIAKVLSESSKLIDCKKTVILISLDISKAFDSINHKILLAKLDHYGIRGPANKLMKSFLTDRIQYVKVGDSISKPGEIKEGVPQGTQKGPPLFSIYINDMRNLRTHCKILKFADDAILIFEVNENSANEIEEDLTIISNYYQNNLLKLNLNKSCALIVGNGVSNSIMKVLNEHSIGVQPEMKYLGIEIDCELKFDSFFTSIKTKLNQAIGVIAVLRRKLTTKPLMNFYFAHFNSHLSYGTFILIRFNSKDIQSLQVLQNRIIKLIHKLPPTTSTNLLYTQHVTNVLPVMGLIFMAICTHVKKSLLQSDDALIQFQKLRSTRTRLLKLNESNTSIRKNDLEIIGASIYNSLPDEIREVNNLIPFKVKLKKFLLSKVASLVSPMQLFTRNKII